ncbi:MAG TPA: hypothetical protein VK179_15110 [Bacteroidales bacterium]|nr:hypothetical protein [Bacteroidales bacterium]
MLFTFMRLVSFILLLLTVFTRIFSVYLEAQRNFIGVKTCMLIKFDNGELFDNSFAVIINFGNIF